MTNLNFSVIGIDFLTAYKLTVDPFNFCLVDKINNRIIPLKPAFTNPLQLCCILPEQSEFHRIFAKYPDILKPLHTSKRKSHCIEHAIPTNGKIVKSKLRRTSLKTQKIIDEQINPWPREGIIFRSDSPYASCPHVVKKMCGSPRVCIDYRNLNATSILSSYPIPHIQLTMDNLFGSKVFSVLDLKSAYFNVPICQQGKHKTAKIVKSGCYEFNYLPFDLKFAPATFIRFIPEVLYSQALNNSSAKSLDNSRTSNPTANIEGDRQSVISSFEPIPSQPTTTRSGRIDKLPTKYTS